MLSEHFLLRSKCSERTNIIIFRLFLKKLSLTIIFLLLPFFCFSFEYKNIFQIQLGGIRKTGYKAPQINTEAIYNFDSKYINCKTGIAFDAESLDFTIEILGQFNFRRKYFNAGISGGFLYHDLYFYGTALDQDFIFIGGVKAGCPSSKTEIYANFTYGWKKSTVFEISENFLFLTDAFSNYDFGLSQEILRTKLQLGFATFSFFRQDLKFIPEIYLKGKVSLYKNFSVISTLKILFSDMSNKTCHPEYIFFKAGIEWYF